jgi:deoxyribodipyrimidine photolyase-related protein
MSILIVIPIHLFDINILKSHLETNKLNDLDTILLLEEPIYFGDRTCDNKLPSKSNPALNFNKLKLIYNRASMQYYYAYLKHNALQLNVKTIEYINYSNLSSNKMYLDIFKKYKGTKLYMFDPVDSLLDVKYSKLLPKITYLDSPLFLCTKADLSDYHKTKANPESYFHASFYTWQRTRLNILANSKTYDTVNRNKMPLDTNIPSLPKNDSKSGNKQYLVEAIKYIEGLFPNNLQPFTTTENDNTVKKAITPDMIHFPISHKAALDWVKHFCKNRLSEFGKYEDSIDSRPRNFLFHSCISPMLNIGLITPLEIIEIVQTYYDKHKASVGIENYEAFIRQVIGWREYQRYIYLYAGNKMRKGNHFSNSRKLTHHWYNGTLGVKPVDDAIKLAINDGYIHHILRLMVMGNFMNLVGIHPDQVYKWFMEFSLDSYDWVMVGNVYSMALWADGGLSMRKPYISGDGYILSMGNYTPKEGESWRALWNAIFHHFIDRNSAQLSKTYYNGLVKAWAKKPSHVKNTELKLAGDFIGAFCD